mgnify:CR=1 FL=1|tara:strand:+ start:506 stop:1231 length:726 start_codon:yes stop_codon:yes gene_type:complete
MLNERSKQIRRDAITLSKSNGGYHYGGTFSCTEILISLYDKILGKDDRFILSKGHGCWSYYVLLRELGYNPSLEGHPHLDLHNGIHWTTGSEGHGFPAGIGMAFARKLQRREGHVFVIVGDGECQEGTTWESLLLASHLKLNNLTIVVDKNGIQGSGFVRDILPINCLGVTAESCGWKVTEVDGHDNSQLEEALQSKGEGPHLIIARTVKGKGVDYMEDVPCWHAKWPDPEHEKEALDQLA